MPKPSDRRPRVILGDVSASILETKDKLMARLDEKGNGIFVSSHECLGVIQEEVNEYHDAVRDNNADAQYKELMDIAVACLFAMASMRSSQMDWL